MTTLQAINKIYASKANEDIKEGLSLIASEFDHFLTLKKKYTQQGLRTACYREIGIKFIGLYGINNLADLVKKAERNNLLA